MNIEANNSSHLLKFTLLSIQHQLAKSSNSSFISHKNPEKLFLSIQNNYTTKRLNNSKEKKFFSSNWPTKDISEIKEAKKHSSNKDNISIEALSGGHNHIKLKVTSNLSFLYKQYLPGILPACQSSSFIYCSNSNIYVENKKFFEEIKSEIINKICCIKHDLYVRRKTKIIAIVLTVMNRKQTLAKKFPEIFYVTDFKNLYNLYNNKTFLKDSACNCNKNEKEHIVDKVARIYGRCIKRYYYQIIEILNNNTISPKKEFLKWIGESENDSASVKQTGKDNGLVLLITLSLSDKPPFTNRKQNNIFKNSKINNYFCSLCLYLIELIGENCRLQPGAPQKITNLSDRNTKMRMYLSKIKRGKKIKWLLTNSILGGKPQSKTTIKKMTLLNYLHHQKHTQFGRRNEKKIKELEGFKDILNDRNTEIFEIYKDAPQQDKRRHEKFQKTPNEIERNGYKNITEKIISIIDEKKINKKINISRENFFDTKDILNSKKFLTKDNKITGYSCGKNFSIENIQNSAEMTFNNTNNYKSGSNDSLLKKFRKGNVNFFWNFENSKNDLKVIKKRQFNKPNFLINFDKMGYKNKQGTNTKALLSVMKILKKKPNRLDKRLNQSHLIRLKHDGNTFFKKQKINSTLKKQLAKFIEKFHKLILQVFENSTMKTEKSIKNSDIYKKLFENHHEATNIKALKFSRASGNEVVKNNSLIDQNTSKKVINEANQPNAFSNKILFIKTRIKRSFLEVIRLFSTRISSLTNLIVFLLTSTQNNPYQKVTRNFLFYEKYFYQPRNYFFSCLKHLNLNKNRKKFFSLSSFHKLSSPIKLFWFFYIYHIEQSNKYFLIKFLKCLKNRILLEKPYKKIEINLKTNLTSLSEDKPNPKLVKASYFQINHLTTKRSSHSHKSFTNKKAIKNTKFFIEKSDEVSKKMFETQERLMGSKKEVLKRKKRMPQSAHNILPLHYTVFEEVKKGWKIADLINDSGLSDRLKRMNETRAKVKLKLINQQPPSTAIKLDESIGHILVINRLDRDEICPTLEKCQVSFLYAPLHRFGRMFYRFQEVIAKNGNFT